MATTDRRGVSVSAVDTPIAGDPNPGLAIKAPCLVATTATITLSGLQTIDGLALLAGARVLVWQQSDPKTNGLYNVSSGPWTRTIDCHSNDQIACGMQVRVTAGATNGGSSFAVTSADPIQIGISAIVFALAGSSSSGPQVTIESAGGGIGKTSAQNSAAINAIIATAGNLQGVRIIAGAGKYNILPPINVNKGLISFEGAGIGITNLQFNPVADGACFDLNVGVATGEINNVSFSKMSLTAPDATFKKTMIKATSQTGLKITDILIGDTPLGGSLLNGGGTGGSIGLYILGHQLLRVENLYCYAEQPIVFGKNPINYISADHYSFKNLNLQGGTGKPVIQYEAGVTIFNNVYDGVALSQGTDGIYIDPSVVYNHVQAVVAAGTGYVVGEVITGAGGTFTTPLQITVVAVNGSGGIIQAAVSRVGVYTVLPGNPVAQASTTGSGTGATFTLASVGGVGLRVANSRFEQGASAAGYNLNIQSPTVGLGSVVLDNFYMDSVRKGIIARNTTGLSLSDVTFTGIDALNVDASVESIFGANVKFGTGSTTTIVGQNTIYAAATPTGYAYSPNFLLSPTAFSETIPAINGGSAAGSTVLIQSTTSGAPVADAVILRTTNLNVNNPFNPTVINFGNAGATSATVNFSGSTSGVTAVKASAVAGGTMTIPNATDTFVGKGTTDELTSKTLTSPVMKGTWTASGTVTLPAFTLGGAVAGGSQNISGLNDLSAVTLTGSTSVTSPVHKSGTTIQFQSNGSTFAGSIDTSQRWLFGLNTTYGNVPAVGINGNTSSTIPSTGASASLAIVGVDNSNSTPQVALMGFASGSAFASPLFSGYRARNTAASPAAVSSGDILFALFGYGYYTSGGPAYGTGSGGGILITATDNYTSTTLGARVDFYATAAGGTGNSIRASVGAGLMVGNTTDRGAGTINLSGGLFLGSFTVASAPTGVAAGNTAYFSNLRVFNGAGVQEGAAAGTGGMANYNGTAWKIAGTNVTIVA